MMCEHEDLSLVMAILPEKYSQTVIASLIQQPQTSLLTWKARGTLLHDSWYRQMLPAISPAKVVLQLLLPHDQVDTAIDVIVDKGKFHMQGAGAVFSHACLKAWNGRDYHSWPDQGLATSDNYQALHPLDFKDNLNVIYCVVEKNQTGIISKAAIDAGAHGPVVQFGEGHGLRDRLGWLRITKQMEKEVLTIVVDDTKADDVFSAMAAAGEMHLPGRGFMFMYPLDKGVYNLPSRASNHAYAANMQQIINAIDNLNGHTHWRDQSAYSSQSKAAKQRKLNVDYSTEKMCLSCVIERDYVDDVIDLMLDAGASGIQISYARFAASETACEIAGAKINKEYAVLRSVLDESLIADICDHISHSTVAQDIHDLCMFTHAVPKIACYVPGNVDYRGAAIPTGISTKSEYSAILR